MTIEIVDLPIEGMVIFHSFLYLYQRVSGATEWPSLVYFTAARSRPNIPNFCGFRPAATNSAAQWISQPPARSSKPGNAMLGRGRNQPFPEAKFWRHGPFRSMIYTYSTCSWNVLDSFFGGIIQTTTMWLFWTPYHKRMSKSNNEHEKTN